MNTIINILTNQFLLLFLTIATGLLLGKIKIKNFSLGVSGGIFTGIVIGWLVMNFANQAREGGTGYSSAARILKSGIVAPAFFTFFLLLFLAAIGLTVGKNIGMIFKKYGIRFVVIGVVIPLASMIVAVGCMKFANIKGDKITGFEIAGMYTGAMTSTPGYGAALDGVDLLDDEQVRLNLGDPVMIPEADAKETAKSQVSLGYTVAFPIGVLVIVIMIAILPKIFRIDIEKEKAAYNRELLENQSTVKQVPDQPLNFMIFALVTVVGIIVGNIKIPLGSIGDFSVGAAGGVLLSALIFSYIGKIGPLNFRMDTKALSTIREMGLTFFMAIVGLTYGYDVVNSLSGSGIMIAVMAFFAEAIAVLISFLIGYKGFKLNWVILSGAICGGCTSAPGLGAALSSIGNDEPTTGYGAAQPFAILANVLLITLFYNLMM